MSTALLLTQLLVIFFSDFKLENLRTHEAAPHRISVPSHVVCLARVGCAAENAVTLDDDVVEQSVIRTAWAFP